jgi:hypothetical protein
MWETGTRSQKLAASIAERDRIAQENVELRALLARVIDERDRYKEKLRQALGAMEDAREMAGASS